MADMMQDRKKITESNCPHRSGGQISPVDALDAMIGHTPLLEIEYRLDGQPGRIFAKYELENMTGSIKDRMAAHILRCAYAADELRSGDMIVEASSGNTGISFAALGAALGHPVRIFMPDWMSRERVQLIQNFGAEVIPVSHSQGGFVGAVDLAEGFVRENERAFRPRQFANEANTQAHELYTGPEIEQQLAVLGRKADAIVAGVGTGGTIMGLARHFRKRDRAGAKVRIHPLEPANSPTLRTGRQVGHHRIQGISDEFIPKVLDLKSLDAIVDVWDGDAIIMAQNMCRSLGLAVGISSGANVLGAMKLAQELGSEAATVVTVLPDSNKKYLSTDLCHEERIEEHYISPRVELSGFKAVR